MVCSTKRDKWFLLQEINAWIREQTGDPSDGLCHEHVELLLGEFGKAATRTGFIQAYTSAAQLICERLLVVGAALRRR